MTGFSERICERFGKWERSAQTAMADYHCLWPKGVFRVRWVESATGSEFAIVQLTGTKDTAEASITTSTQH